MTTGRAGRVARAAALAAGVTLLASCNGDTMPAGWQTGDAWDADATDALPRHENPFLAALHEGYVEIARAELADYDWVNGAEFLARATDAAAGAPPDPYPAPASEGMAEAFAPLGVFLHAPGAMLRAGRQIGEAQVTWDCWTSELVEELGRQDTAKLEACHDRYTALIALIEDVAELPGDMVVVLPEEGEVGGVVVEQDGNSVLLDQAWAAAGTGSASMGTMAVHETEIAEAFGQALGARPKPHETFTVTFDFGASRITDQEYQHIMRIADEVRSRDAAEVLVVGHADAPGGSGENLAISSRRAAVVRAAIVDELRKGETPQFSVAARGENEPAINTPRVERQNRRVVVTVR